jgi:hypothetical protein
VGAFLGELNLTYIDGDSWRLLAPLVYETSAGDVITVPAGFVTDFASIPRPLWAIAPPAGTWGLAAVLHDWGYRTGLLSRGEADRLFLDAMADLKVRWVTRWAMYLAVRAAGWTAYRGPSTAVVVTPPASGTTVTATTPDGVSTTVPSITIPESRAQL